MTSSISLEAGSIQRASAHWEAADRTQARLRLFVGSIMFCCLFLQRFGLPFGDQALNIVGPLGLGLAGFAVLGGALALQPQRLAIFLLLLVLVAIGEIWASCGLGIHAQISMPSIIQFLGISAFTVFVFAEPMDEETFFRIVNKFLLVIAWAGVLQFFAQFAGLHITEFTGILPSSILAETNWNMTIAVGIGELNKSNGFFLVEPSVTSQFMAMAIIIEVLYFRRLVYLAIFGIALVLAFSGTGEIVLLGFLVAVTVRLGLRGLAVAALLMLFAAVIAGAVMLISPDIADMALGRLSEFSTPGTSGFERFITPFWLLSDMLGRDPMAGIVGIGGGTAEHLTMPYSYDVNTPVKITLEYGFPALICYVMLFVIGKRTARQSVLLVPAILLLMFTGGYQQFGPVVYVVSLLIGTAWLKPSPATKPA